MGKPERMPGPTFDLMKECCSEDPLDRPSLDSIVEVFSELEKQAMSPAFTFAEFGMALGFRAVSHSQSVRNPPWSHTETNTQSRNHAITL